MKFQIGYMAFISIVLLLMGTWELIKKILLQIFLKRKNQQNIINKPIIQRLIGSTLDHEISY